MFFLQNGSEEVQVAVVIMSNHYAINAAVDVVERMSHGYVKIGV